MNHAIAARCIIPVAWPLSSGGPAFGGFFSLASSCSVLVASACISGAAILSQILYINEDWNQMNLRQNISRRASAGWQISMPLPVP